MIIITAEKELEYWLDFVSVYEEKKQIIFYVFFLLDAYSIWNS